MHLTNSYNIVKFLTNSLQVPNDMANIIFDPPLCQIKPSDETWFMATYCLVKSFQLPFKPNINTWRLAIGVAITKLPIHFQVQNYQFMIKKR